MKQSGNLRLIKFRAVIAIIAVYVVFATFASLLSADQYAIENTYIPKGIYSDKVQRQLEAHLNPDYVNRYLTPNGTQNGLETKFPPRVIEMKLTDDPLLKKGYINLKWYAKGDGVTDDTDAMMDAIYDAFYFQLALYIPSGTYLVSDTLECCINRNGKNADGTNRVVYFLGYGFSIIGDKTNRPVIKLKDNTPAFGDTKKPRPVLEMFNSAWAFFWKDKQNPRWENNADNIYTGGFSSLVIDCGKGNPGAVGVRLPGAQATYAENIKVLAYGAYAGIRDVPGNSGYMANVEVYGGTYGILYAGGKTGGGVGNVVSGCTLIDQDAAAIRHENFQSPLTVAGFKIEKKQGSVIELEINPYENGGSLALVDGTVLLKEKSPCFVNINNTKGIQGRDLYLRNVYVKNADTLIQSFGRKAIPAQSGEWSHIKEYAYAASKSTTVINGRESADELISIDGAAPDDPMKRHLLSSREIPMGFDADAVSIKDVAVMGKMAAVGDGVVDDTKAFRYAISKYKNVFVPKGIYRITGNLKLKTDTVLFGISEPLSRIWADIASWESGGETSIISTPDDAAATCMLSQLKIVTFLNGTKFKGKLPPEVPWKIGWPIVDWKAGKNSVVKNITVNPGNWSDPSISPNGPLIRISGNGGGRWYGFEGGNNFWGLKQTPENYLHLLIDGTRSPLIMYSLCVIHGRMDYYMGVRDSQNIEMFGISQETHPYAAGCIKFQRCSNVVLVGYFGSGVLKDNPQGLTDFLFEDCQDVTVGLMVNCKFYKNGGYKFKVKNGATESLLVPIQTNCAYFRIGDKPSSPIK